jgi:cell division GTPase FtsZ
MNAKVIGIGAAGNKAAITLIEKGVIPKSGALLLNSTLKDVPAGYKDIATQFSGALGGCGKERDIAKTLVLESLQNGTLSVDGLLDPDDKMVIIVNSSEGGTGCGSSSILAKYFKEVLKANVHMFVFTGFEEDGRGLKNTVEYFQDLREDYTVGYQQ